MSTIRLQKKINAAIIKNNSHYYFLKVLLAMTTIKLSALKPGDTGIIAALNTEEDLYHRLAALGFRIGKQINIIRSARFSGPLHVRIGTTDVMLRRNEAQKIDIQPFHNI